VSAVSAVSMSFLPPHATSTRVATTRNVAFIVLLTALPLALQCWSSRRRCRSSRRL
jgi:hypothetical protein